MTNQRLKCRQYQLMYTVKNLID